MVFFSKFSFSFLIFQPGIVAVSHDVCSKRVFVFCQETHGRSKKRLKRAFLRKRKYGAYANTRIISRETTRKPLAGLLITCRFCGFGTRQ